MNVLQQQAVAAAGKLAQRALKAALEAQWCDAVPLLLALQWGPMRAAQQDPRLHSTGSAIQAWLQVRGSRQGTLPTVPPCSGVRPLML